MNAMSDSSAHPGATGDRCAAVGVQQCRAALPALRVLCPAEEIAGPVTELLCEAMHALTVGDVRDISRDIG